MESPPFLGVYRQREWRLSEVVPFLFHVTALCYSRLFALGCGVGVHILEMYLRTMQRAA